MRGIREQVETCEVSESLGSELTPADIVLAKAIHIAKPKVMGPSEELQSHMIKGIDTKKW